MRSSRLYLLAAALFAGLLGGGVLLSLQPGNFPAARVMDRRCRGGCTDTALLRVLAGGVSPGQIATGSLSTSKGGAVTTTRASNKTCTNAAGTLVYLTANQPCVEAQGLLVEGGSTNLLLQSSALDNVAWTASAAGASAPTITANATSAPDGTLTAERIDVPAVAAGQQSEIYQGFSALAGTTYSNAIYLLGAGGTSGTVYAAIQGNPTTFQSCAYNPTTWTRCAVTNTQTVTQTSYSILGVSPLGPVLTPTSGALSFYAWGEQTEAQPFATSYIPTTSTSAARAADVVSVPNPLPAAGTSFCVYETLTPQSGRAWNTGVSRAAWNLNSFLASNSAYSQVDGDGNLYAWIYDATATSAYGFTGFAFANGSTHRIGQCLSGSTVTEFVDGVSQAVTPGGAGTRAMSAQAGSFYIGGVSSGLQLAGYVSDVCLASTPGACR